MAHMAGIDEGPVMDWTNDNGLDECYGKWKKVEILFKGPLNMANDAVQLHYLLEWRPWNGFSR